MKSQILNIEIRNRTEIIKEQQELVLAHDGKIPQIELDLLMGNVRKLYESILALNKINNQAPSFTPQPNPIPVNHTPYSNQLIANISIPEKTEPEKQTEQNFQAEEIIDIQPEIIASVNSSENKEPETLFAMSDVPVNISPEEIKNELVPSLVISQERTREYNKSAGKAAPTASLFDDHQTVAEKFKGSPSLFDKFSAAKQDSSVADKHLKNPVSDLKKSIGINEKFSFINDLFDGDLNSYNEAIDHLNNSAGQQQALAILHSDLLSKYNWNGDSDAFKKLQNLVVRRFVV